MLRRAEIILMISGVGKVYGRAMTAGIDNAVSDQWGRISAIRSVPVIDGLLAAMALTHDLTLVTRKDRDVAGLGAREMNPFGDDGEGN